nr:hypothetical protein L204_04008 [Cryptococcus depauperatus CBS 7855]
MSRPRALRRLAQLTPTSKRAYARFLNTKTGPTHGPAAVDYRIFEGLPGFLPRENFERLQEWQGGLWERLQSEVNNNPGLLEIKQKWDRNGLDIADLLDTTARDKSLGLAFNYGSLLANNSFFLESIASILFNAGEKMKPTRDVANVAERLLEKAEGYAEGIVGGGWLWIARTGDLTSDLDIIPTFSAGTLLVANRAQQGRRGDGPLYEQPRHSIPNESDSATGPITSDADSSSTLPSSSSTLPSSSSISEFSSRSLSRAVYPSPVAVLNLFELAWLGNKYGVWSKRDYVRDWFENLNWQKLEERNARVTPKL